MGVIRLLGIGFAIIVLLRLGELALANPGTFSVILAILGAALVGAYLLTNPLLLPYNRQNLVSMCNELIDSLGITSADTLKAHLSRAASESMLTPKKVGEFESCVEKTLVQAIALAKIQPHMATLRRKRAQNTYKDDYGILHEDGWLKECEYFVTVVLLPLDHPIPEFANFTGRYDLLNDLSNSKVVEAWVEYLDDLIDADDSRTYLNDLTTMSGHDYETFVGNIVEECDWEVQVTKGSGDQGADVIAARDGVRIVIQCKLYASTVGNKAVQEVFAAKSFYDCDYAFVVSNSTYTPSARKVAERTGVQLLHHDELPEKLEALCA